MGEFVGWQIRNLCKHLVVVIISVAHRDAVTYRQLFPMGKHLRACDLRICQTATLRNFTGSVDCFRQPIDVFADSLDYETKPLPQVLLTETPQRCRIEGSNDTNRTTASILKVLAPPTQSLKEMICNASACETANRRSGIDAFQLPFKMVAAGVSADPDGLLLRSS